MALKLGIQTYQILTNYDEVCIPSLFSILLAIHLQIILCVIYYHLGHDNGEGKTEIELQREEERREKLKSIQDVLDKAEKILGHKPESLNDIARLDTCVTMVDCKAFSGDLTSAQNLVDRFQDIDEEDEGSVSTLLIDQIEFAK